jgi:hypothetical protein
MRFINTLIATLLSLLVLLSPVRGIFGGGKKEQQDNADLSAKETVALGLNAMYESMKDPNSMKEAMEMLNDPATRKEVEKLMSDPEFKKEMEKLQNNPVYRQAMEGAKEMFADAGKAARIQREVAAATGTMSDAELGMSELMKASKNPKLIAEALESMKDPEIAAEVSAPYSMMNVSSSVNRQICNRLIIIRFKP